MARISLPNNAIHVWLLKTIHHYEKNIVDHCYLLLDTNEKQRYARFYFDQDRQQYLLTRALLRTTLSKYFQDVKPKEWEFVNGRFGKPRIDSAKHPLKLHFNISHTKGMVVVAFSSLNELGIDLEDTRKTINITDIIKDSFTESERIDINSKQNQSKVDRFYEYWTLKESYTKSIGKGLSFNLNDLSFNIDTANSISLRINGASSDKNFFQLYQLDNHYRLSLCVHHNKQLPVEFFVACKKVFSCSNQKIEIHLLYNS